MTEELKPCAHCGNDDVVIQKYAPFDAPECYTVNCKKCHVVINTDMSHHCLYRPYNHKYIKIMEGWYDNEWPKYDPGRWVICNPANHAGYNFNVTHWMPIPPLPEPK